MLRFFRSGGVAQALVAAIAVAIIVIFALEFRPGRGAGGPSLSRTCAVRIEGRCVDRKDYFAAEGLALRGVAPAVIKREGLRAKILEGLVERELLLMEAERLGLGVGEEQIEPELMAGRARVTLPAAEAAKLGPSLGLIDGVRLLQVKSPQTKAFDYEIYQRVIKSWSNRSPKEFSLWQRRELLAERVRDLVRARVRVADAEVFQAFEREKSKVVVRSVHVAKEWVAKWGVDLSDAAVDRWAAENVAQVDEAWKTEEPKFKAGCLLVREIAVPFAKDATSDEKVGARDRLEQAKERIDDGRPFALEARLTGTGDAAVVGGSIGCLDESYGEGAKELLAAAQSLAPGKVSAIVETPSGFHLLQLEAKLAEKDARTYGRRHVARRLAWKFLADEATRKLAAAIVERAKSGAKLEEAATALATELVEQTWGKPTAPAPGKTPEPHPALAADDRPKVSISAPFSIRSNPLREVPASATFAAKAFALAAPDAVHPEPIPARDGWVVLQLKEKEPATRAAFENEKHLWTRTLLAMKQDEAVARYLAQLRAAVKGKLEVDQKLAEDPAGAERDEG
ncbi:MAG: peptidylprolyl isomerase [Polyangiaceae bacterium]|nr:peptidylprolyl isomerase [Polyangiaceae bacterium]